MSMRIVSLLPSATEILCLIGASELIVGRSHECDFPPEVRSRPVLTSARVTAEDPAEIDRQVRELHSTGGAQSLYRLDSGLLAELRPDVIVTQDLCEVCSIDLGTVQAAIAAMAGMNPRPRVVSLNPMTFDGVLDDILRVGSELGGAFVARARREVVALRERMHAAGEFVNPFDDGPSVAFLEWTAPIFAGGHWTPQLIERAGGRHPLNPTVPPAEAEGGEGVGSGVGPQAASRRAGKSVRVPPQVLAATAPEYVVVAPCGLDLEKTAAAVRGIEGTEWWNSLPAVRKALGGADRARGGEFARVALVDGNQMFNRPGPRLVDAYEFLVGFLNGRPELIPAGFPWRAWPRGRE